MGKDDDMFQHTKKSIIGNCFSIVEEYKLWELLGQRIKEGRKCLASAIVDKVDENDEVIKSYEKYKELYLFILKKCFWETEAGTMNAEKLTSKIVNDFIIEVMEEFGLKEYEESLFMQMLQMGLNRMEDEGILKFSPDRLLFRKYVASKNDISFIKNLYLETETEKIMEWAKKHPADVRAQAVSMWFTKGLTLTDIVTLTKRGCWGRPDERIKRAGIELFQIPIRGEIVRRALDTHPKDVKYVFSVPSSDYSTWERLTERGLLIKLKAICKKTGIVYKPILINEAIRLE